MSKVVVFECMKCGRCCRNLLRDIGEGMMILLYCDQCGAIQGVTMKQS